MSTNGPMRRGGQRSELLRSRRRPPGGMERSGEPDAIAFGTCHCDHDGTSGEHDNSVGAQPFPTHGLAVCVSASTTSASVGMRPRASIPGVPLLRYRSSPTPPSEAMSPGSSARWVKRPNVETFRTQVTGQCGPRRADAFHSARVQSTEAASLRPRHGLCWPVRVAGRNPSGFETVDADKRCVHRSVVMEFGRRRLAY